MGEFARKIESKQEERKSSHARISLLRCLIDLLSLPERQISPQERQLTGDIIENILSDAHIQERKKCVERLVGLKEIPHRVLMLLSQDEIEVSRQLLERGKSFSDSDLLRISKNMGEEHRQAICRRKSLSTPLTDVIIEKSDYKTVIILLQNEGSRISQQSMERLVNRCGQFSKIVPYIYKRPELRMREALQLFWNAESKIRQMILQRFALERRILQESCSYIFTLLAQEESQDEEINKILQVIERRQINRSALHKSSFPDLQAVISTAARMQDRKLLDEIAYFSNIAPITFERILEDEGGEGIAVFCKAVGLKRQAISELVRTFVLPNNGNQYCENLTQRALITYDILAMEKAQTALRYWNWLFTGKTPAGHSRNLDPIRNRPYLLNNRR